MENKLIISILISLLFLGACSFQEKEIQSEVQIPQQDILADEVKSEPIEEEMIHDSNVELIDDNKLYLSGGPDKSQYDSGTYLELGESFIVGNSGQMYGEVSLDSFEIIEDSNGSGRKALLLWFTETNTTNQPIEVGLYGTEPMVSPNVFYDDFSFQRLSHYQPDTKFFDPEYIENTHVQYGDESITKPQSCAYSVTLEPNESRTCFSHYSYAGKGDYLISQMIDGANSVTPENFKSYLIEVN